MGDTVTAAVPVRDTAVGTLDRVMEVLAGVEAGAGTIGELAKVTGQSRSTISRLAIALEQHGLLGRGEGRRLRLGPRLVSLGAAAVSGASYIEALRETARPALTQLSEGTGESAQLYVKMGDRRVCVASSESANELRTIVDVGAALPLTAGSAGKIFLGYATETERERLLRDIPPLTGSTVTDPERLERHVYYARRRGWAQSAEEREQGVASVSAPVIDSLGRLAAVVSVSGPVQRLGRRPGQHYSAAVVHAARSIEQALGFS
jgi:DNA-binding IclR family transcriptional regulator